MKAMHSVLLSTLLLVSIVAFALAGQVSEAAEAPLGADGSSLAALFLGTPIDGAASCDASSQPSPSGLFSEPFWMNMNQFGSCPYTCSECYAACQSMACRTFCDIAICPNCPG